MPGPVSAAVLAVIDGDTMTVRARIWLGQELETLVRLDGIDAPELRGRCAFERALALKAKERLTVLAGAEVLLYNVRFDKYGGRVVARVTTEEGIDLGKSLVDADLARPYDGGKRLPWCAVESGH